MKSLIKAVAIAAVLAIPAVSFAQSNQPVTRAQVRAELVQLEKAGYNPAEADQTNYPADLQAAEARVAANEAKVQSSGYGSATNGVSQSGQRADVQFGATSQSVFQHH
jgi:Tfp pilus assembly protein PilE